jgi:hypothetical protein
VLEEERERRARMIQKPSLRPYNSNVYNRHLDNYLKPRSPTKRVRVLSPMAK